MKQDRQVIIIGSGPAGVAAAITCSRAGLEPLVITCASPEAKEDEALQEPLESIHPGVAVLLRELGLEQVLEQSTFGTYEGIIANGKEMLLSLVPGETWSGYHISKSIFNQLLLTHLQALSIDTYFETKVTDINYSQPSRPVIVTDTGAKFSADYLIDTSGQRRLVGKRLELGERFLSPPLLSYTGLTDRPRPGRPQASFDTSANGWTWHALNRFGQYTVTSVIIGKRRPTASPGTSQVKYANSRWRIFDRLAGEGFFLAGDAAGILDPAAGQGILMGLMSGIMAGRAIIKAVNHPTSAAIEQAIYHQWFTDQFDQKARELCIRYRAMGIRLNDWVAGN
jgi:flavin-dependent dehydrogenase